VKGGVSVMARGGSPLWRVEALSGTAIRLPIPFHWDASEYLMAARAKGLDVAAVMDRDAFPNWSDWRHNADEAFVRMREYADRGLVQAVFVGNEWDDGWRGGDMPDDPMVTPRGGVSSWVLPFSQMGEMMLIARGHFPRGGTPLILGGMSSGQPDAINTLDLSLVDGIAIHPYGKRPERDWPSPNWGFGFIGDWLDGLVSRLEERGLDTRMGVGELGVASYNTDEGTQAEWFKRMLAYLRARGDIDFTFMFCDSDQNVDGYGAFKVDERPKACVTTISAAYSVLPPASILSLPAAPPEPVEPPVEEPDEDEEPEPVGWWDQHLTAEQIAQALATVRTKLNRPTDPSEVLEDIRANWPEFGPFMRSYGRENSVRCKIALLATIFVDEVGSWDYFERNYGPGTSAGIVLGNIYPGDGARFHGRGYQLTGRSNYQAFGDLLDVPLIDMPEEANHPTVAAGCMVAFCELRGMFTQADLGNWEQVRKIYNGGLNGWQGFILSVNTLLEALDTPVPDEDIDTETLEATLRAVMDRGATRIGDPYVWDGERPGGFDCSGFITWCYREALGISITSYTDAIYGETEPITAESALPGDIVLYEYWDPTQPQTRFPHVGLVTERPDITLDARGGVGVGYHAHVQGAARYYRRARGLGAVVDPEESMWKEKAENFINAIAYVGDKVADTLEAERAQLDDYGEPPKPPKPAKKMLKADWQKYALALEAWSARVRENTDARYQGIGAVGSEIRRVRVEQVGPRP
jgi:hypothetical protein